MRASVPSLLAQRATGRERVGDDRIGLELVRQAHQHARALLALGEQPELAQRRQVARDVGLALAQQLGELADRELFFGRGASRRRRTGSARIL